MHNVYKKPRVNGNALCWEQQELERRGRDGALGQGRIEIWHG
jgi:hypothetical protein